MMLRVIDCGEAFSMINCNPSFVLEENGKKLLIDCAGRIPLALTNSGTRLSDIAAVCIGHAHCRASGALDAMTRASLSGCSSRARTTRRWYFTTDGFGGFVAVGDTFEV
jgi:hypothetical protein